MYYNDFMPKPIYLEPDEEITSIIDRLKKEPEEALVLVVPTGAILLSSLINLRLLKERAHQLNKKIALVTTDEAGGAIAVKAGLATFETLGEAKEAKMKVEPETLAENNTFSKKSISGGIFHQPEEKAPVEDVLQKEDIDDPGIFDAEELEQSESKKANIYTEKDLPAIPEERRYPMSADRQTRSAKKAASPREAYESGGRRMPNAKMISLIGGAIFVFLVLATFIFPHATVYVTANTKEQELSLSVKLTADKDKAGKEIKNTLLASWQTEEENVSMEFATTGQKNVGDKARGTISVFNRTGRAYSLSADSEFKSQEKIFVNKQPVVIPSAGVSDYGELVMGKVTFEVEAITGGVAYNIAAGKFSIASIKEMTNLIYGTSDQPMTGGSDRQAKVMIEEDLKGAQDKVEEVAKNKIEEKYGIKGEDIFVKGLAASKILQTDSSKKVDEEADKFVVSSKVQFSFLTFKRPDFDKLLTDSLPLMISDQSALIGDGYRSVTWEVIKFDADKKEAELLSKPRVVIGSKIKEDFLKAKLAGLTVPEIRGVLEQYPDTSLTNVRFFPPFLVKTAPADENRVSVRIKYVEQ